MEQRDKIVLEFQQLNCIRDWDYLNLYIDFCISKSKDRKSKSSSHHILPRAKNLPFKNFSNLLENPWNRSELSYYDHYYAHFLLAKAIDHISISSAFVAMHKKDLKLFRITEDQLVEKSEFEKIYRERNKKISEWRLAKIETDHGLISRASHIQRLKIYTPEQKSRMRARVVGNNNPVHKHGVVDKILLKKLTTYIDGKNLNTISAERAAITMKKEIIIDGDITTIYRENGKKLSKTLKQTVIINGLSISKSALRAKTKQRSSIFLGKWYKVKSALDESYEEVLAAIHVRGVCANLESKTVANYLGKSKFGKTMFRNKPNLIGLYCEIYEPTPEYRNLYLDRTLGKYTVP
jgi:hypothetical protein